jgi:hypothetical protein
MSEDEIESFSNHVVSTFVRMHGLDATDPKWESIKFLIQKDLPLFQKVFAERKQENK